MAKNEQEQPKTIAWYEAQTKELMDIRKAYYNLYDNNGDDAYFPDLVEKKFQELKELKEKIESDESAERNNPKHFPKSWGY